MKNQHSRSSKIPVNPHPVWAVAGAVRFVTGQYRALDSFISEHISQNHAQWEKAEEQLTAFRKLVPTFATSAVVAFCFKHPGINLAAELKNGAATKLNESVDTIKAQYGNLASRASREACLAKLYQVTGMEQSYV